MAKTAPLTRIGIILTVLLCTVSVTSCASREVASTSAENSAEPAASVQEAQEGTAPAEENGDEQFYVEITMAGGSGKAHIESPVEITRTQEGMTAAFVWSSENYDYMIVDGVRYDNVNTGGPSTFHVPVKSLDEPLSVIGDTVAMSTPHEIEYVITWGQRLETVSAEAPEADSAEEDRGGLQADDTAAVAAGLAEALEKSGNARSGELSTEYAVGYNVTYYGSYASVCIPGSGVYLLVPEGADVPEGIPLETVILKKPLTDTYLVSTSAMDLISSCGALPSIRLTGTKASEWYIDEAVDAMERGDILYAGKYSAPDYELILSEGCRLAVENTMIYHEPEAKAKLEELGIPVLVETSSYEQHPLGRLEWIKLYGLLYDQQDEAKKVFDEQAERVRELTSDQTDTGKSVAFFHVTAGGLINVRRSGDYITSMIEMAGGHYALENAGRGENALSSMNMQMEDFYAQARDADILIYNSTIGGGIASVSELVGKNPLFADFRAVREGRVYCTDRSLFQQISGMAEFLTDLHDIFRDVERDHIYIKRLE